MRRLAFLWSLLAFVLVVAWPAKVFADLSHETVSGVAVTRVWLGKKGSEQRQEVGWDDLSLPKAHAVYTIRFKVEDPNVEAVLVPHCNSRERVYIDGAPIGDPKAKGPLVLHPTPPAEIAFDVEASTYEKRIACAEPPRVGVAVRSTDGLSVIRFASPDRARGGGEATVFIPGGHDRSKPAALLVGAHPWNGGPWTYAAYKELIEEAGKRDVVLLMPSGLGNSLYVAEAEDEVMRAIAAIEQELAIDRQRVSIWGASMGGAGATTIGFHHPDRFAFIASYFGDSRYDLTTYVRGVLGGEEGARRVNCLDVLENARHVPVYLVHGEDDHTSPIRQSIMLYEAMKKIGFDVSFDRVPTMTHEGPLVVKYIRKVVQRAAEAIAPSRPARVSFRSVRPSDTEAYGVKITRSPAMTPDKDAFIDIEQRDGVIHVHALTGVTQVVLANDALGAKPSSPVTWSPVGARAPIVWAK